ncbi:L,D-transpeptidase [Pseudonocardia spinosispora]|uniref:L,D-transpeptidase n=1 Tax=Pseudonocardia spinosispora TaxID=103441 RepID=UPI00040DA9D1|nr:L,D-transpeptidase [Pseudonocardia spinosispora]
MVRNSGSGVRRVSIPVRIASVTATVLLTALAFAAPALADDNDNDHDGDRGRQSSNDSGVIAGTPCTDTARACVDLKSQKAWLIDEDGNIDRGPVSVSSGSPKEPTPVGTFNVQWKDKAHKSAEFKLPNGQGAPMPYAVFFAEGGVAFHGGSVRRASAGCVHLSDADATAFYDKLQLGDEVQVH